MNVKNISRWLVLFFCVFGLSVAQADNQERIEINLNTASSFKLMKLPYMNRSLAKAIVKQRKQQGNFEKVEDVLQVKGMTPELVDKIGVQVDGQGQIIASYVLDVNEGSGMAIPNY